MRAKTIDHQPDARPDRATVILQFFAAGMVAVGEIDLISQDDKPR